MLAKKITYTDFNGEERTETFYFNLTEAELAEMELSTTGGLQSLIKKIVETKDQVQLVALFKEVILKSYGEKSADGKAFRKRDLIRGNYADDFESTEAYSVLFMELATQDGKAAEFINGIIPAKMRDAAAKNNHPALANH